MFGFQRIGDLAWAAGDLRARGFLIGGTAGRTTLAGEGLQHQDGHSLIQASTIPNCVAYDPAYAYELAVIVQDGMRRMFQEQESCFYYITAMNENYLQPAMPEGSAEGILKGMHRVQTEEARKDAGSQGPRVQLLGGGAILREALAAADLLARDFGVSADVWSVTSFNELRREGIDCERWNLLHPESEPRRSYVAASLGGTRGPVIAATDYMRTYADQIRPYIQRRYTVLGTDGFGRSDMRSQLRKFFEVNRYYIALAALKALADDGDIPATQVTQAIAKYRIDPDKPNPVTV
jgi:pyruvate dehydrogenase E1 component